MHYKLKFVQISGKKHVDQITNVDSTVKLANDINLEERDIEN